jgi:hypothetical protein
MLTLFLRSLSLCSLVCIVDSERCLSSFSHFIKLDSISGDDCGSGGEVHTRVLTSKFRHRGSARAKAAIQILRRGMD